MKENYVLLLDIYGEILAKSQREALDLRFNSDLTLAEIAEEMGGISRQSVNDFIKKGKARLLELESVLGSAEKFQTISGEVLNAENLLSDITDCNKNTKIYELKNSIAKIKAAINS